MSKEGSFRDKYRTCCLGIEIENAVLTGYNGAFLCDTTLDFLTSLGIKNFLLKDGKSLSDTSQLLSFEGFQLATQTPRISLLVT